MHWITTVGVLSKIKPTSKFDTFDCAVFGSGKIQIQHVQCMQILK